MGYEEASVRVAGGEMHVGRWGARGPVAVAVHGVTATHADFHAVADALGDDVRLVAPDLRGRGQSRDLGGPYGMVAHADDVADVIEQVAGGPVTLVGHSMGAFVALVAAHRRPELVRELVLVDGGLPIDVGPLAEGPVEAVVEALLGPSLERLRMTFSSADEYVAFWRPHPALAADWNDYVEQRVRYDLCGVPPELRSTVQEEAVVEDTRSDIFGDDVPRALDGLRQPAAFLWAPRGQFNQEPPLYPWSVVEQWADRLPTLRTVQVPGVNHFTLLLAPRGAAAVAEAVRATFEVTEPVGA
jgi:lipase